MADERDSPRRRGRPKGSGLDDSATLSAILNLLDAQPGLRPTTAIKQLGIVDPSAIRRLRDKLSATLAGPPEDQPNVAPAGSQTQRPAAQAPPSYARRPQTQADGSPRSGTGTRVRARLGIPTTGAAKPIPERPRLKPLDQTIADLTQALPPRATQTVAHMKLLLEATAALTKLQQLLLADLDPSTHQE